MKTWHEVLLAISIVIIDTVVFYVPLTSILAAYIIVAQPPWFLRLVAKAHKISDRMQSDDESSHRVWRAALGLAPARNRY